MLRGKKIIVIKKRLDLIGKKIKNNEIVTKINKFKNHLK
jgi:hypothetical protein